MDTAINHPVPDRVKPSCNDIRALTLSQRQSARMSKITNDGLTQSHTGWFIAVVPIWQQRVSRVKQ